MRDSGGIRPNFDQAKKIITKYLENSNMNIFGGSDVTNKLFVIEIGKLVLEIGKFLLTWIW